MDDILKSSPIFRKELHPRLDDQLSSSSNDRADLIRKEHRVAFKGLDRVVAEYDGFIYRGNIMMIESLKA